MSSFFVKCRTSSAVPGGNYEVYHRPVSLETSRGRSLSNAHRLEMCGAVKLSPSSTPSRTRVVIDPLETLKVAHPRDGAPQSPPSFAGGREGTARGPA